jgi:DNA-binding MarR family transcriptional regulator
MDASLNPAGSPLADAPRLDPAETPTRRVTWGIHRAELAVQAAKEPGLRTVGVPNAHYALLMTIRTYPGLSGAELGRRLGVTTQAVALLATKLQTRGLVERRIHPRHRNVQELHLTDAGDEALDQAEAVIVRLERRVYEALGPERYAQLRALLDDVVADLTGSTDSDVDSTQ